MELNFKKAEKSQEILDVFEHNVGAFSDSPDFNWTLKEIKHEVSEGWELFSVSSDDDIVAALFYRVDGDSLLTKNTALKMHFQGSGYSHQIKEFYEKVARELKLKKIKHYCRIDNFRMYSLNESHGYVKSKEKMEDEKVVEWEKLLK
ncbi:MAG: hypothetical protein HN509_04270 [Halobacteriovoraceae bacterium]|mgnify:CR=1 FL=1|jgi:hypothetical protein|nr:hypothetical protein [Halobacteriovoraceae bacterium]MBT5096035.1 hypothetical protein [Halobacteriovoraceae bacterium]